MQLAQEFSGEQLGWPRIGLLRVAPSESVRHAPLTPDEVASGLDGDSSWVPFEKGDDSDEGGGARWRRDNPIVIDWSRDAVALLRKRARQTESHRKPRLQNEQLWGRSGVTWNRVARYLRARLVPEGGIFSSEAPTIAATVDWLDTELLLALLNSPVVDFLLRNFLGSLMHMDIGDARRIPIPVLDEAESHRLTELGGRALAAKQAVDEGRAGESLSEVETEIDRVVRDLYGIDRHAELWVVR